MEAYDGVVTISPVPKAGIAGTGDAGLRAAILRIGSSLDVDTVLREVVDSARELTGARYGVIATVDDAGQPQDFVTSGFTPEQHRALTEWPDGPALFAHQRGLAAPLRLPDLSAYVRSLGYAPFPIPCGSFQATPMRHRGAHAGGFSLGGKEGGFTDADEELLLLFAAQAAAAIANARAHRDEQRARADLEALVETAPVGVVVLDAATGAPRSINREARRIAAGLNAAGHSLEQLQKVLTCRRGDGREVTLDELGSAETLRSEEVEMAAPDGSSVRTLIDATPIRAADGAVERVVVTIRDLAPLEELERSRTEFLAMVSHELRAPLAAIKGSATTVLGAERVLDSAEVRQFFRIIEEQADRMDGLLGDLLEAGRIETGTVAVDPAPAAVADLVERARTAFVGGGHAITVDLEPDLPRVMADMPRIVQVLNNLLANAARHAPATSPIRVAAVRDGTQVAVSVADQGAGMTPQRLARLFRKHGGGRQRSGLGLFICKGLVEAHGGRIRAESGGAGHGTRMTFTLPAVEETAAGSAAVGGSAAFGKDREKTPILVVDDDPQALRHVRDALAAAGYAPVVTGEPQEVPRLLATRQPRLVLLDLMLPGADGIELLQTLPALADLPVIFISAYGRDETVARALEAGAADYLVKPFSATELTARVGAALRRRADPEPFRLGDLAIDYARSRVTVAGRPVHLTATEYKLLRVLSRDAGGILTYDALLHQVWGAPAGSNPQPVRSFAKKLRRKLGERSGDSQYILTERGLGYRMPAPDDP